MPDFHWVFFFFLRAYTLWQRVLKIHAGFFLTIFFSFLHLHVTTSSAREGRLVVCGKLPSLAVHTNTQLDTGIFSPFFFFFLIKHTYILKSSHVLHFAKEIYLLLKWWNCWAAIPLFQQQTYVFCCFCQKNWNFDCFRFLKDVYLMYKWWHCWAAMPLFVYQIFLLSFLKDWKVLYF